MEIQPDHINQALFQYADFLHNQFGVQTLADYSAYFYRAAEPGQTSQNKTYQLHTLKEDETLARLATGIQRFKLPDDANYIRIYQEIAANKNQYDPEKAVNTLAEIFEHRRQYDRAAEFWRRSIKEFGPGSDHYKQKKLDQILGHWGQFEPIMAQAAGKPATIEYRFRNGRHIRFTAHAILVPKLLGDVKQYLKSNPANLDWDKMNIEDIGYRLVTKKQNQYIGAKAAEWSLDLQPAQGHFDKRITVQTPLKKPGAYLLTGRMQDGNTSQIMIWLHDTVIVKKPLNQGTFLFTADAVNGRPLADMQMEFFGYQQKPTDWQKVVGRQYNVITTHFSRFSDPQGQLILGPKDLNEQWQWIITAQNKSGRLAYLGFSNIWYAGYYEQQYSQVKVFTITDRPVYRPNQTVKQGTSYTREKNFSNRSRLERLVIIRSDQLFRCRCADPQGITRQSIQSRSRREL
ncbi:MAG: hypothetical protein EHM45_16785 [Desulfobacteraceae bacterium]|nr:MAG: hypothetical protein EHM45_16785 [Desulfobacteraceae bacterium]